MRHVFEQFQLDLFLGAEVGEKPALGHAHLVSENAEGYSGQARLAHDREALGEDLVVG
jgi:hypothetical protein